MADLDSAAAICNSVGERDDILAALGLPAGDLNGDGNVDFTDFLVLSGAFGTDESFYSLGNVDMENGTGFGDFLELSGNFGLTAGATAAAIPEPSSVALLALGALLLGLVRRRGANHYCF